MKITYLPSPSPRIGVQTTLSDLQYGELAQSLHTIWQYKIDESGVYWKKDYGGKYYSKNEWRYSTMNDPLFQWEADNLRIRIVESI